MSPELVSGCGTLCMRNWTFFLLYFVSISIRLSSSFETNFIFAVILGILFFISVILNNLLAFITFVTSVCQFVKYKM